MSCLPILGTTVICEYIVSSISLAFTTHGSTLRQLYICLLFILAALELWLLAFLQGPPFLCGVIAFCCLVKLLHFISLFLILKVEIHQLVRSFPCPYSIRLCAALNCVTSTRGVGTPWEVKTRPHRRELPKSRYIVERLMALGWQYMALDLLNFGALRYFHYSWPEALAPGAELLRPTSTREQWASRLPLACILGANLRLLFAMVYGGLATTSVLLGMTAPTDWPPLFGTMDQFQVSSIRHFWGRYWHQLLRWPLVTISAHLRRRLKLRISSSRQGQETIQSFLVFSLSGLLHMLSAGYAGVFDSLGWIFLFFIANPVIIRVEDAFELQSNGALYIRGLRIPGFMWGLCWLYVCVPFFAYTGLRLPVETNVVMPLSLVDEFGSFPVLGILIISTFLWNIIRASKVCDM